MGTNEQGSVQWSRAISLGGSDEFAAEPYGGIQDAAGGLVVVGATGGAAAGTCSCCRRTMRVSEGGLDTVVLARERVGRLPVPDNCAHNPCKFMYLENYRQ